MDTIGIAHPEFITCVKRALGRVDQLCSKQTLYIIMRVLCILILSDPFAAVSIVFIVKMDGKGLHAPIKMGTTRL